MVSGEAAEPQTLTNVGGIPTGELFGQAKVAVFTPPPAERTFKIAGEIREVKAGAKTRKFKAIRRRRI